MGDKHSIFVYFKYFNENLIKAANKNN